MIKASAGLTDEEKAMAGGAVILPHPREVMYYEEDGSASQVESYYALLGVVPDSSHAEIKGAWIHSLRKEQRLLRTASTDTEKKQREANIAVLNQAKDTLFFHRQRYDDMFGADMNEVCPGLFLGALSAAANLPALKKKSIGTVLTVAMGIGLQLPGELRHLTIEVDDDSSQDLLPFIQQGIDYIRSALDVGCPILVHCFAGVSRSAAMVIAYIMQTRKVPLAVAFKEVKLCRQFVDPNPGFIRQLMVFEECGFKVPAADVYRPLVEAADPRSLVIDWNEAAAEASRETRVEAEAKGRRL